MTSQVNCWQYSLACWRHPQALMMFSSLLDQFYLLQVNSHLPAPSLYEGAPPMNFLYHPRSGSSHIYLTNPLSSGILQLQSEIVADPKNRNFCSERNITEICYCEYNFRSWIKRDQLNVTCFIISLFNAQHVSDVNTSILRSLQLMCCVILWVVLLWFDACCCYVVVWLGWCGICMQAEADTTPPQPNRSVTPNEYCFSLQTDTTPLQPNHNVTPTE